MSTERWAAVPGWEGCYQVSDQGRVKSLARSPEGRAGVGLNLAEKVLRGSSNHDGYRVVALCRDNVKTEIRVHRLVLLAFVGPCPDGREACHNDGDRSNNALDNLRWDTRSENTKDKVRHGTHPMASRVTCINGHPFTPENTYTPPNAQHARRMCRACRLDAKRRYNARRAVA